MSKESKLASQVANLEAQNARIIAELDEAKRTIKRSEDAVFQYEPLWIAAEKHNEELEASASDLQQRLDAGIELKEYKPEDLEVGKTYLIYNEGDYVVAFWEDNSMWDSSDLGWIKIEDVPLCAGPIKETP